MSAINPIRPVSHAQGSSKAKGTSQSAATAAKVNQIVELPVVKQTGLQGRDVKPLKYVSDLAKNIRTDWDLLEPEELAGKIIELQDRVAEIKETSPAIDKIKKQGEHFEFRFVFPVALELETSGKSMPPSFARTVHSLAKQVFDTHSLQPFNRLSPVQQQEIIQIAARSGA